MYLLFKEDDSWVSTENSKHEYHVQQDDIPESAVRWYYAQLGMHPLPPPPQAALPAALPPQPQFGRQPVAPLASRLPPATGSGIAQLVEEAKKPRPANKIAFQVSDKASAQQTQPTGPVTFQGGIVCSVPSSTEKGPAVSGPAKKTRRERQIPPSNTLIDTAFVPYRDSEREEELAQPRLSPSELMNATVFHLLAMHEQDAGWQTYGAFKDFLN